MPTYGYRCPKCGLEFEVWQRMSDDPTSACPTCGTTSRRLFFPAGIVFKGTGFYKTDSRKTASSGDGASTKSASDGATKKKSGDSTSATSSTSASTD